MPNGDSDDRWKRLRDKVTPTLQPVPGIDLDEYKKTLIERFSNPKIRDRQAKRVPEWIGQNS
jgi:mannitol 2-dehydrogenase